MNTREIILRKSIPVVINSFNQPSYLGNIVGKFRRNGFSNIIVLDNNSSGNEISSLYDFLRSIGVTIIYYGDNKGPRYFHLSGAFRIFDKIPHLYTDPDLDFNLLSENFVSLMLDVSVKYSIFKVGCALTIPDKEEQKSSYYCVGPSGAGKKLSVAEWEGQFWKEEVEPGIFNGPIDTTLHLFNPEYFNEAKGFITGLRIAKSGFAVRHLPWFKNDIMPEEEKMNYKNLDINKWSNY